MIARYNNQYFNISLVRVPTRIWRYDYVEGFNKKVKDDGLVVYEKFIDLTDAEEVFDVGFSVNWDGQWCGVSFSEKKNLLGLVTTNRDFAEAHGMEEFERGTFDCALSADNFTEYRVWKKDYLTKESTYSMVSYEEFKMLWKKMIADLIPPRG